MTIEESYETLHAFVDVTWHEDALCAHIGGDWWYPEKGESATAAKAICRACPVRAECLDYSLTWRQRFGIWGGATEHDRRDLIKELDVPIGDAA